MHWPARSCKQEFCFWGGICPFCTKNLSGFSKLGGGGGVKIWGGFLLTLPSKLVLPIYRFISKALFRTIFLAELFVLLPITSVLCAPPKLCRCKSFGAVAPKTGMTYRTRYDLTTFKKNMKTVLLCQPLNAPIFSYCFATRHWMCT